MKPSDIIEHLPTDAPPMGMQEFCERVASNVTPQELLGDRKELLRFAHELENARVADGDTAFYGAAGSYRIDVPKRSLTLKRQNADGSLESTRYMYSGDFFELEEQGKKHYYFIAPAPEGTLREEDKLVIDDRKPYDLSPQAKERMSEALQLSDEEMAIHFGNREFANDFGWDGYTDDFSKYNAVEQQLFTSTLFRFTKTGGNSEFFNYVTQAWEEPQAGYYHSLTYEPAYKRVGRFFFSILPRR